MVLIAPRYGGKKHLMTHLFNRLRDEGISPLVQLRLSQPAAISTDVEFRDLLARAVSEADESFDDYLEISDDLFGPLDWLVRRSGGPVTLLASNVDSLSQRLARGLLQKARSLVEDKKSIAVLSGEDVFQLLVSGPNSEFNCANQYFIQGFDREWFASETARYRNFLRLRFESEEEIVSRLYELSGSHLSLMKVLLREVIEARLTGGRSLDEPITAPEIRPSINPDLLRQPPRVINNAPECWGTLKRLLRDDTQSVESAAITPGPLELAGVVIRDGWNIRIASPVLKSFLRAFYTDKQFGDIYVRNGDWENAFAHYERVSEEDSARPSTIDDRREAVLTIKALSAAFHSAAARGTEDVVRLFLKGCRYVLGFREVAWLRWDGGWTQLSVPECESREETFRELSKVLPASEPRPGLWPVAGLLGQRVMIAIVPTVRSDQYRAVVIGDCAADRVISRERKMLAEEMLAHFVTAYEQAVKIEAARIREQVRDQHLEIVNAIFDDLGGHKSNVQQLLELAARALRKLGYRRVMFCLVDRQNKRIQGVLDDSNDKSLDVAEMIDRELDHPQMTLQAYVIKSGKPVIVADPDREPLIQKREVITLARMKSFAVAPLLNRAGAAIGTIHVEREDDHAPSREEVEGLMKLGRQLAIAIGQSERVSLLQSALNKIPVSLVIVDSERRLQYANQDAAELLGVEADWQDQAQALTLTENELSAEAIEMIQMSSREGRRLERHIKGLGSNNAYGCESLSDAITDWRGKTVGAFLRMRDLTYIYRMFEAFRHIAEAKDTGSAMESMLRAVQQLGYKWGRLYLVNPRDPDRLVSQLSFGFQDSRRERDFNQGKIFLERRNRPGKESWKCLDEGAPLVFHFTKSKENGSAHTTAKGQEATAITEPRSLVELEKKLEDFWVDIPLLTRDGKALGKLTIQWDESYWPHDFQLLRVLAETASGVLDAFQQREREAEEQIHMIQVDAAHRIMATMAHNLGTRLAALPALRARYTLKERELPALKELNARFSHILNDTMTIINRAKERLIIVSPQLTSLDLVSRFEHTLHSALAPNAWKLESYKRPFMARVDGHLLEIALLEVIQNSKEAAVDAALLRVTVALEPERIRGRDWVRIIYRDNGPGVPDEFKKTIFDDFFSRRPNRKIGAGLGLGYVRRVVEAHGGWICESGRPDEGVKFIIGIPRAYAVEQMKEQNHVSHSPG